MPKTTRKRMGRPPTSGRVTIEVVRNSQLDMVKLAHALELYMHYMKETRENVTTEVE